MKTISFTTAYWHEIEQKLNIYTDFANKLDFVDIKLFSNNLEKLIIIFQCMPLDFKGHKVLEYKIQRRKTKTLELYLILDYERIMQGTDPENLNHIKEVFLKGCETFLKPLKDFKWNEFEEQLKQIL